MENNYSNREINAFLNYAKRGDICREAGISRSRYDSLRKNENFMGMIREMRTEAISDCVRRLERLLGTCADELEGIILDRDTAAQTRLYAIRTALDTYCRLSETENIIERLDRLEAQTSQNLPF